MSEDISPVTVKCYRPVATYHCIMDGSYVTILSNGQVVTGNSRGGIHPRWQEKFERRIVDEG